MQEIFPQTARRLEEWKADPEVRGVLLVGSKSRGYGDALSDDDLEVYFSEEAFARIEPASCLDLLVEGEGSERRIVYDAQRTSLADLHRKAASAFDLDHWPYEKARILFDRDGALAHAVHAAGRMEESFRRLRLLHATIDAGTPPYRAIKTRKRGMEAAVPWILADGCRALARLLFALEWRWVPLLHWLEPELASLGDPTGAGPRLLEALSTGRPEPLQQALAGLEELLAAEGVPRPAGRRALFLELIHSSRAEERAVHGMWG